MDKSQLRRLALDFAKGNVDHEAYVRERTELIDSIVAGEIGIEREAPAPRPEPITAHAEPDPAPTIRIEPPPKRLSPLHIVVGGALIAAIVAVFLSIGDEAPVTQLPRPAVSTVPPPTAPEAPAAKQLVDGFLDSNDWGATGIANFIGAWQALDDQQRAEALSAPWFRTLSTALKQEINAQRALAGLDGGTGARVEGRRLVKFARSLGVAGPFPNFEERGNGTTDAPASASVPSTSEQEVPTATEPAATSPAPPTSFNAGSPATVIDVAAAAPNRATPANGQAVGESSWLNQHDDDAVTVQLFAVNRLDEVDRLVAEHPDLSLRVLRAADENSPRFRVVKGPFADASSARASYAELPDSLKKGSDTPVLRTVAELRSLLDGNRSGEPSRAGSKAGVALDATASAAPGTAQRFTLQLFASDKRDNVERLMASYGELDLRLHRGAGPDAAYRVLFGDFDSAAAASAAVAGLPPALLRSTGTPIIKLSGNPDGPTVPQP